MIKIALLASTAAMAFMSSEFVEVVTVKGQDGKPLRVNKSDYDADQAEGGAKAYTLHKDEAEQSTASPVQMIDPAQQQPLAAPSAPDFNGPNDDPNALIDPLKNAIAPSAPSPNQRLVSKEGKAGKERYFVVDGSGARITMDGIDPAGYETEQGAWKAIMDLPH